MYAIALLICLVVGEFSTPCVFWEGFTDEFDY